MALAGRVGLFGGSFNPPHVGHLVVAEGARDAAALDRVLWMPAATPPHKRDDALPAAEHRLAMTRLATEDHAAFDVSDLELRRSGVSYTVDTLRALQADHPDAEFLLLIGGDSLAQFHTWHEPEEILRRVELLVYPRPGFALSDLDAAVRRRATVLDRPLLDLSSTAVRGLLRAGRSARYLVPDPALAYAEAHGLYR